MVQLSVLIAILHLLELTGLGMIKTAGLEITIMLVPVIVGAIVMGPGAGALLGGVFGLISFWECFGKSSFGVVLMGINGLVEAIVCFFTGAVIAKAVVFSRGKLAARRTAVQNGK